MVQIVFFTNDIFDTSQNNLLFNFLSSHGEKADHLEIGQDHKTLVAAFRNLPLITLCILKESPIGMYTWGLPK